MLALLIAPLPPALPREWGAGDWIALAALAAFFGFLGLGAWRLRRIKRLGLAGHAHCEIRAGNWQLTWPGWWPDPAPAQAGLEAGPLDHDGRLLLLELEGAEAAGAPDDFLRQFLQERGFRLDEWDREELEGRHGLIHLVEGRASADLGQRAYLWLARVPGPEGAALVLLYRASVLYGLADGFWLAEVAARARRDSGDFPAVPR